VARVGSGPVVSAALGSPAGVWWPSECGLSGLGTSWRATASAAATAAATCGSVEVSNQLAMEASSSPVSVAAAGGLVLGGFVAEHAVLPWCAEHAGEPFEGFAVGPLGTSHTLFASPWAICGRVLQVLVGEDFGGGSGRP